MKVEMWLVALAGCAVGAGSADSGTAQTTPPSSTGSVEKYHPPGWDEPLVHGMATKLGAGLDDQGGDCRDCHGASLEGDGDAVACSSCHEPDWATDCTYCHGDPDDGTGAPPRDLANETDPARLSFPSHRVHVDEGAIHADYACAACHDAPTSALTSGHLFDDHTPGRAEVILVGPGAAYDDDVRTCTVYCHGDGTGLPGTIAVAGSKLTCASCHAATPTTGHHPAHRSAGVFCDACHADVDATGTSITDPGPHVDGTASVSLPNGMTLNPATLTCNGTCHNDPHVDRHW